MTAWDILDKIIGSFPPIVMTLMLAAILAAVVIFIVGFSKHGINFLKYGFKQIALNDSLEKRFDNLEAKIEAIETNHFAHLKGFLTELTSILLDKKILNNQDKARLDNQLQSM